MKEKIIKLAKGITDLETPDISISPESLSGNVRAGGSAEFDIAVESLNGFSVKGIAVSDDMRATVSNGTFAGRRAHIGLSLDASGLSEGSRISGALQLITNAGLIGYSYSFEVIKADIGRDASPAEVVDNPLTYEERTPEKRRTAGRAIIPKDDGKLSETVSSLISEGDVSAYAFLAYKEAISRHLSVTRLYESYVAAYPDDCREPMPREVLLYFSYDNEIPPELCEKLYADILLFEEPDSEITESFAARMSAFAMSEAVSGRISARLGLIYDRMIYRGMIDLKAAAALPDIFKCHEIKITKGHADYALITYPELNSAVRARIINGTAYAPVYFKDAAVNFYRYEEITDTADGGISDSDGDSDGNAASDGAAAVSGEIKYTDRAMFDKPELLTKCFELYPAHKMLTLSACRQIIRDGMACQKDRDILINGLKEPEFTSAFRKKIIGALCAGRGSMEWLKYIGAEDIDGDTAGDVLEALIKTGDYLRAWRLLMHCGTECADDELLKALAEGLLDENADAIGGDSAFLKLCRYLFGHDRASGNVLEFLQRNWFGSAEDMLKIKAAADREGLPPGDIAERIITTELFDDERTDIDEAFKAYVTQCRYDDMVVRAYLTLRSGDYFLYDAVVDESIFFDALYSYVSAQDDPLKLPVICLIALTSHFADKDELDEKETALCQKLTDGLISEGLIFRYTKKLRKKINIPEEISWKYFIEYKAPKESTDTPRLLVKILPDETEYREEQFKKVYRNVYVTETVLFIGDSLHYLVYAAPGDREPAEEGTINVVKLHKQGSERMRAINLMMKAIDAGDGEKLKENMLSYIENAETVKRLFDLETL